MISKFTRISDVSTCIDIGLKNAICHNCSGNSKKGPSCSHPFAENNAPIHDLQVSERGLSRRVRNYISAWKELIAKGYAAPSTRLDVWIADSSIQVEKVDYTSTSRRTCRASNTTNYECTDKRKGRRGSNTTESASTPPLLHLSLITET